jgi:hypothetical protein
VNYGNIEYTMDGVYTLVTDNSAGCDSISWLKVTIYEPIHAFVDTVLCEGATVMLNDIVYDSTGSYTQTITSIHGCDSMIHIGIMINSVSDDVVLVNDTTLHAVNGFSTYQWLNCDNNDPIPNATGQDFTPAANGSYAAQIISPYGCTAMTECYIVSTLSLAESSVAALSVYPNPCTDILHVSGKGTRYEIRSADGRLITCGTPGLSEIDLSVCSKGMYRISVIDEYGAVSATLTFVKQ